MSKKSIRNYVALTTSLTIVSAGAIVLLSSVNLSAVSHSPTVSAQGGSGGGGFKPSLPADFSSDVPLPTGKLFGSTGSSPAWSVGITATGSYPSAMANVRTLYTSNGYTDLNSTDTIPFGFENATYTIKVVGQNHDHSATSTDVTVAVTKK